jgi:hypothetical protein
MNTNLASMTPVRSRKRTADIERGLNNLDFSGFLSKAKTPAYGRGNGSLILTW